MKTFETLYARNSSGQINEWTIKVQTNGKTVQAQMIISEGLIDRKKTETINNILKGKNIGKMNATSPYEQACNQAQSRWEKKKKQGYKSLKDLNVVGYDDLEKWIDKQHLFYVLDIKLPQNRTDENDISKPMKAQKYFKDDGSVRINFPCYGQPKLNGFRVIARWETIKTGEGLFVQEEEKVVFRSKEGLRYDILEHIEKEFIKEMFFISGINEKEEDIDLQIAYDGEMYIHGEILSEISSAVRKKNLNTSRIQFHIFDIAVGELSQKDRNTILNRMHMTHFVKNSANVICCIGSVTVNSNEEAQQLTDEWIKNGYEGGIFRDMKAHYQFGKRPQTMVKLKRSQDKEFKVVDVIGGENAPELGVFICLAENGKTFKCNPEGNHDLKRKYLSEKQNYIGKLLTVKFFERTKDDLPFHAVGVTIRDYE